MIIYKSKAYEKDYRKKLKSKHKNEEMERIKDIEELILDSDTLKDLLQNPLSIIYNIYKKSNNLKEIYTANINSKIRLYLKPVGEYPYNTNEITEIEFLEIDDRHYGEG